MNFSVTSIIVAAGTGSRMQHATPKAFLPLDDGKPILMHTLMALQKHDALQNFVVVYNREHQKWLDELTFDGKTQSCHGGLRRQDSVLAGLHHIASNPPNNRPHKIPSHVLIHDAARPFVTIDLLKTLLETAKQNPDACIIPGLTPTDTIKQINNNGDVVTLPRDSLIAVQTPQLFPFQALYQLHQTTSQQTFTDDAGLFEMAGKKTIAIAGETGNIKITYPQDIR